MGGVRGREGGRGSGPSKKREHDPVEEHFLDDMRDMMHER